MKRQAAYNGEIGANGKEYRKGQFIAEQAFYLGTATKVKGSGKQEIEPNVWEIPEDNGVKSIYRFVQGVYGDVVTGEINATAVAYHGENPKKIESLIARYQNGERWYYLNNEIYV